MFGKNSRRELDSLRRDFHREADAVFDSMFGQDGQNGLVTFNQREDEACSGGDRLTRWLLQEHMAADPCAESVEPANCPLCDKPLTACLAKDAQIEEREIKTRRGAVQFERARRRCAHCRRIFFPTGRAIGAKG